MLASLIMVDEGNSDRDSDELTPLLSQPFLKHSIRRSRRRPTGTTRDLEGRPTHSLGSESDGFSRAKDTPSPLKIGDYVSTDGLHDLVKESSRLCALYSRRGLRARISQAWDGMSGWLAVSLMGMLTACVAFLVDVSVVTVSSWKLGYCRTGFWKAEASCCAMTTREVTIVGSRSMSRRDLHGSKGVMILADGTMGRHCDDWIRWNDDFFSSYAIYVASALAFGVISASLTLLTKKKVAITPDTGNLDATLPPRYENGAAEEPDAIAPETLREDQRTAPEKTNGSSQGKTLYMAAGSGIPEIKTIISGYHIPNYLDLKVLVVKAVGSVFAVSTGMCLGKEGPFVHISTCVANLVASRQPKYRDNGRKMREMLSAGCAAGLCVAFGAPIGGVLFSFEEISARFPRKVLWRAFTCSLWAAAVLKYLNPTGTGKLVLFETTFYTVYSLRHYLVFVSLGLAGGVFGGVFCKLNFRWSKWFRSFSIIKNHSVLEAFLVVLATATMQYPNVVLRHPGDQIVENLLIDCRNTANAEAWVCINEHGNWNEKSEYMAWLVYGSFTKLILTVITFGVKVPSGIIIPAMNAGAFFGRLVGQFPFIAGALQPGIFAMVGAVAFLAGVCRMTISLVAIMLELTGEAEYIIPHMIGIIVAKWVADAIEPEGVYDLAQTLLGHPFLDGDVALSIAQREAAIVEDLIPSQQKIGDFIIEVPFSGLLDVQMIRGRLKILVDGGLRNAGLILTREETVIGFLSNTEFEASLERAHLAESTLLVSKIRVADCGLGDQELEGTFEHEEVDIRLFVDRTPLTIVRGTPVERVSELVSKMGLGYLLVVDQNPGRVCGVIVEKHLLDWLQKKKAQRRRHGERPQSKGILRPSTIRGLYGGPV